MPPVSAIRARRWLVKAPVRPVALPLGRAVPVELVHRVPEQPARFLRARAGPALLDENRLQHKIGQRAGNALQRCFMRERRAFLIPVCPPLWKTEKDAGCTCSGSARSREDRCAGLLRPRVDGLGGGEQALRGHRGLHVEEKAAAIVGFRAPQGAGWTLRVTSSSMVPRPPSGCSWRRFSPARLAPDSGSVQMWSGAIAPSAVLDRLAGAGEALAGGRLEQRLGARSASAGLRR